MAHTEGQQGMGRVSRTVVSYSHSRRLSPCPLSEHTHALCPGSTLRRVCVCVCYVYSSTIQTERHPDAHQWERG